MLSNECKTFFPISRLYIPTVPCIFLSMWISSDEFLRHRFSLSKTYKTSSKARDIFRNDIGYFLAKGNGNFQTQKLVRSCTCLPRKKLKV